MLARVLLGGGAAAIHNLNLNYKRAVTQLKLHCDSNRRYAFEAARIGESAGNHGRLSQAFLRGALVTTPEFSRHSNFTKGEATTHRHVLASSFLWGRVWSLRCTP